MGDSGAVLVEEDGAAARVTINRPATHNAFDDEIVAMLRGAFERLAAAPSVRAIILTGAGKSFCAGADLNWMRKAAGYTREQNVADARALSEMFASLRGCPKPVIAMVNGAAFGGGVGLVAASDVAVASEGALFSFSEAKLGLIPAVISPYVIERIGPAAARRLFVTGERFGAAHAREMGLVDAVSPAEELNGCVMGVVEQILSSGPAAVAEAKRLVGRISASPKDASEYAINAIAEIRSSPEGKEGVAAFLDKRKPSWRRE